MSHKNVQKLFLRHIGNSEKDAVVWFITCLNKFKIIDIDVNRVRNNY